MEARLRTVGGFAVHIFTACGAVCALFALQWATLRGWVAMFLWLALAGLIDALDGPIARRVRVRDHLPRWSGDTLDLVVDFLTYVFVPAYALMMGDLVPPLAAPVMGAVIVVSGAIYFADTRMKLEGNYFRGFPALWNVVVFYLFALRPWPWLSVVLIIGFAVATFLPFKFVHPLRVRHWRAPTLAALALWALLAAVALAQNLEPQGWVAWALVLIAGYFAAVGLADRREREPIEPVTPEEGRG